MTATPIPRTLQMSLSGMRDLSRDRDAARGIGAPIKTYVRPEYDEAGQDAIRRELARGGQVFFVHNRVERIDEAAAAR